eukprot:3405646-Rhodomonas_salina.1
MPGSVKGRAKRRNSQTGIRPEDVMARVLSPLHDILASPTALHRSSPTAPASPYDPNVVARVSDLSLIHI